MYVYVYVYTKETTHTKTNQVTQLCVCVWKEKKCHQGKDTHTPKPTKLLNSVYVYGGKTKCHQGKDTHTPKPAKLLNSVYVYVFGQRLAREEYI